MTVLPDSFPTSRRLARGWAATAKRFTPYEAAEPLAGAFRAKQLQAVLRLTPLTMLANLVNATMIGGMLWESAHPLALLTWFAATVLAATWGMRAWLAQRRGPPRPTASRRALRRTTLHAAALAGLWGIALLVWGRDASGDRQMLLWMMTTGMICAGGFALATVPAAATVFVVILGGSATLLSVLSLGPMHDPAALSLLLLYAFIAVSGVHTASRSFGARLMAEAEAERQNQVIGLLLRDFEESTSDLLWEIDRAGRFCANSARLAALWGLDENALARLPALELIERLSTEDPGADTAPLQTLRNHFAKASAFRDIVLPLSAHGTRRWWSLTAKPLHDEAGQCVGWRGVAADVTQAQVATDRLTWLAHFDPLTGLTNRHQFRNVLAGVLAGGFAARPCAVLCLDLDRFKMINDTLGHAVGDGLLQVVANRLTSATRRDDLVARLGGDEFAVLLRNIESPEEIALLTRRILDALHAPCEIQGASITVRSSVGIAIAPRDGTQIDQLLSHADLALYAAKALGRDAFRFFAPEMADQTQRRRLIDQALRGALERGEFALVFQPQVEIAAWRVSGFEALLRWHHPLLGDVSPVEFIPVAEDAGLIREIGAWVLEQACTLARGWPRGLTVSVNVSAVQVMSQDFAALVRDVLDRTGLAAAQLQVEITESVFMHESHTTMQVLRAVRALGVRIALDDFGTGYSSLAYLRRFPFHTLKIDRAFVGELVARRDARAIVRTVVGLARTLEMTTVAEGIEEPAQIEVLRRYGCDAVQGYCISQPLAATAVEAFLARWAEQPAMPPHEVQPTGPLPIGPAGALAVRA